MKQYLLICLVMSSSYVGEHVAAQDLTITIEVNPQTPTQLIVPSFNPPPSINVPPAVSAPPSVSANPAASGSNSETATSSFGEECLSPDSLTNEVGRSLQRVDALGQAAASSGNSQNLVALTSEFNRLEGLLNSLITIYGEDIINSGIPACDNLANSLQAFIEEVQAYLEVLQQQLFTLLW